MARRIPRARSSSLGTTQAGILGVLPSEPEIIGVYPSLSASFRPHGQEIIFRRGDSIDIPIQVQDDQDPPDPVMISGGVIRWSAKQNAMAEPSPADSNVALLLRKTTYDNGIELTNDTNGQAILHIYPDDTRAFPHVSASWDLEVTRVTEDLLVSATCAPGTRPRARVSAGSDVVTIEGYDLGSLDLRRGDLVSIQGLTVLIAEVLSGAMLRVGYTDWASAIGLDFVISRGQTKTVASGPFTLLLDITV